MVGRGGGGGLEVSVFSVFGLIWPSLPRLQRSLALFGLRHLWSYVFDPVIRNKKGTGD